MGKHHLPWLPGPGEHDILGGTCKTGFAVFRRGCGAAEGGGSQFHHQVSIYVCKRSLSAVAERLSRALTGKGKLLSWAPEELGIRQLVVEQAWGWRAEQGWASFRPGSEHNNITGCFLTGLKDPASTVPERGTLAIISLLCYVFKGLFWLASDWDLLTQRGDGRERGRAEAGRVLLPLTANKPCCCKGNCSCRYCLLIRYLRVIKTSWHEGERMRQPCPTAVLDNLILPAQLASS